MNFTQDEINIFLKVFKNIKLCDSKIEINEFISVENWSKGQFLRSIEMGQKMDDNTLIEIQEFCKKHNCPAIVQYDGIFFVNGPEEFIKEKT